MDLEASIPRSLLFVGDMLSDRTDIPFENDTVLFLVCRRSGVGGLLLLLSGVGGLLLFLIDDVV